MQFIGQRIMGVRGGRRGRGLEDLCDVFQADGGVRVLFCRRVKGRTGRESEVRDDCIWADGVQDVSEGLGSERGDGEIDGSCEEGEKEGGRRRVVAVREIGYWGRTRKGRGEGVECAWNERRGNVKRGTAAVEARDAYPRESR